MNVQLFQPSKLLRPLIENYMLVDVDWMKVSPTATVWRLIPFGQISMLFLYGDPHGYNLSGANAPMSDTSNAFMVGQLTQPIWLKFSGHTRMIKIQFKPSGIQQLLPLNMIEFTNVPSIDLDSIWGSPVNDLLEQLHNCSEDHQRTALLDDFLERKLLPLNMQAAYIDYTFKQLEASGGNVNISKLETKLGITSRHLERLFKTRVGLTPKEISKVIRLNHAFRSLEKTPDMSLTSLSHESGYFDQSHFSKDFKKITGISPSKLFSSDSDELFVTQGKCFLKKPASAYY